LPDGDALPDRSAEIGQAEWLDLHEKVLAGDKVAFAMVAEKYLEDVKRILKKLRPDAEDELLTDATTDAFMNYFLHPERFDPSKRSLRSYLVMSAKGDLLNLLEKRNRQRQREVTGSGGELQLNDRNDLGEEDAELWRAIERSFFPDDLTAVRMMLGGVKSYEEYARVWGIDPSNVPKMRREVKRRKTRIRRALARIYKKWKESSDG